MYGSRGAAAIANVRELRSRGANLLERESRLECSAPLLAQLEEEGGGRHAARLVMRRG